MRTLGLVRTLNRLIQTCRDGEEFCRVSSAHARAADLRNLLYYCSEEWGRLGDELQALVLLLGGQPATSGTVGARIRQLWLTARSMVLGGGDSALIEDWHMAQEHALARYEEALKGYLPERIRRTVSLQADRIAERCDHVGSLRDQHAIPSQRA